MSKSLPYNTYVSGSLCDAYVYLSPSVAPTIYQQPQDQIIVQPNIATFICSANGLPQPDITWLRVLNGLSLIITASSKYSMVTMPVGTKNQTSTLVVSNTSNDDATTYTCRAENTVSSTDASATLAVQGIAAVYVALCKRIAIDLMLILCS